MTSIIVSAKTGKQSVVDLPPPPEPTPEEILAAERASAKAFRAKAYADEADPLFFKAQRGEASEQEWLDAIEAIRARYPYPEEASK